jgi:hypothetical protein
MDTDITGVDIVSYAQQLETIMMLDAPRVPVKIKFFKIMSIKFRVILSSGSTFYHFTHDLWAYPTFFNASSISLSVVGSSMVDGIV